MCWLSRQVKERNLGRVSTVGGCVPWHHINYTLKSRVRLGETLRFKGNKIHCFQRDQFVLLLSLSWKETQTYQALEVNINHMTIMAPFVTVWSGVLAGNSTLSPSDVQNVAHFCKMSPAQGCLAGNSLFVR